MIVRPLEGRLEGQEPYLFTLLYLVLLIFQFSYLQIRFPFSTFLLLSFQIINFLFIHRFVCFILYLSTLLQADPGHYTNKNSPHVLSMRLFYLSDTFCKFAGWDGAYPRPPCPSVIAVRLARPVRPVRRPPPSVNCLRFEIPIVSLRRKHVASFIQTKKRNKAKASKREPLEQNGTFAFKPSVAHQSIDDAKGGERSDGDGA